MLTFTDNGIGKPRFGGQTIEFDCDSYEEVDTNHYVQVTLGSSGYLWTYIDPSSTLAVGDEVVVPYGYNDAPAFGVVKKLGKGNWNGPYKNVSRRIIRTVWL